VKNKQQKGEGTVWPTPVPKCSTAVFMNQLKIANSKPAQGQQLAIDDTLGGPTRKESSLTHITVTA
jgi:hypothetical protein